jgi:hypothetical protein
MLYCFSHTSSPEENVFVQRKSRLQLFRVTGYLNWFWKKKMLEMLHLTHSPSPPSYTPRGV